MTKYELAQKQGNDSIFTYYTFDNEVITAKPHIHICTDSEEWQGKTSSNGLKTVATVELQHPYNFAEVFDNNITEKHFKTAIISWLNTNYISFNGKVLDITNAEKALEDYIRNNYNL